MNKEQEILSEITIFNKYAKYVPELNRRESWEEICNRYRDMMISKYPKLEVDIRTNMEWIYTKRVLPSMRAMQFAGKAINKNESRIYNCAFLPIDDYRAFSESMFLLLGGTGVGYSVQYHHVDKLNEINKPTKTRKYVVSDSLEGWADAIKVLMKSYIGGAQYKPRFDYSDIRHKGARLVTAGGKAPGPRPLMECISKIEALFENKQNGTKLTPLECHDIQCYIANAVLSGGIRRSAMIALFSFDDQEMLTCKYGNWWELNEQRGRANNSAVIVRNRIKKDEFEKIWEKIELSNSGEPGLYFTNNADWGTNPCCFTGEMKLLTPEGYKTFKELSYEENFPLLNIRGEIVEGKVWSNGLKQTINLKLSNGKTISCTDDHRLMLNDGTEVLANQTLDKRLMPYYKTNKEISEFVKLGFIQGDASTGRLDSLTHKGLEIYFGEKDLDVAEIFGYNQVGKQYVNGYNEKLKELEFSSEQLPNRVLPKGYYKLSKTERLHFLKGLFSANGCVIKNNRVSFKTTCSALAVQLVNTLREVSTEKYTPQCNAYITTNKAKIVQFSNGNYECKESYDINISRINDIKWFTEHIGFIQEYKQKSLEELIITKSPKVISIKPGKIEEVFDFNLDDDTHWGIVEGVIAHNCEIALRPFQFCNLCEVNVSDIESQDDLNTRVSIASFFGTLQAGFTDFHYLRPIWRKTTEKDALIGVGMTGIASGEILKYNLEEASDIAKQTNVVISSFIGINKAARTTTIKPSGTTSCVLGTSSGIHAWHNDYYIRRIRLTKNDPLYTYVAKVLPDLVEDDKLQYNTAILSIPQKAPEGSILRTESALDLLERVKKFNLQWVKSGHRSGDNTNNVSATISIKKSTEYIDQLGLSYPCDEWKVVGNWMWKNKDTFNGLSVLPYDNGSYVQAPFEDITKEKYDEMCKHLHNIDLTQVIESDDNTEHTQEAACAGGTCEIN